MENLNIKAQKVGIVHHPFCLKHSNGEDNHDDIEMAKEDYEHPERP